MRNLYKDNKKYVDKLLFLLGFFVFGYIFLAHLLTYVAPFVVGFVISAIISPLVGFLQRKLKIARSITTILLIIIIILLVAIAGTSLFNRVVIEAGRLTETLPATFEEVTVIIYDLGDNIDRFMTILPEEFPVDFNAIANDAIGAATTWVGDLAMRISVGFVTGIPLLIMNVFICLISAFFFTKDKKLISESMAKGFPERARTRMRTIQKGLLSAVGGYVRAQLTIMSVVFSISVLGLVILRYPFAVLMALLIALFDAMPMIGTGIVFWPWAIISFASGNPSFGIGILVINGCCFVTRQLLEPKVLGQQIGLHPLIVLLGIYIGFNVFGIFGLFLGPIFTVIAKLIVRSTPSVTAEPVPEPVPEPIPEAEPEPEPEPEVKNESEGQGGNAG